MTQAVKNALEVIEVTKRYGSSSGGMFALRGVSFSVSQGEFVAIVGPSGSGKSSMLNIIGALDRPTSGRVLISDSDLSSLNNNELAKLRNERIGFVFQSFNLIARMTALENIALPMLLGGAGPKERKTRAAELLEEFDMETKADNKPGELSGGEQQRVAVARALANDPPIILADEPTGNLDSKNSELMMEIFHRLNADSRKTVVMITHNLDLAKRAGKILSIKDGKVDLIREN